MARPDRIHFIIPTPYAWSADESDTDRVEVVLTPATGTSFEDTFTVIGTVKGATDMKNQWYWQFSGSLQAQIIWSVNGSQIDSEQKTVNLNASLELARSESDDFDRLLRGSLSLPIAPFDAVNWQEQLQQLWPTNKLADIEQLRIEPTGLFILGNLPRAFFPSTPPPIDTRVVLRVPQSKSDLRVPQSESEQRSQNNFRTMFRWDDALSTKQLDTTAKRLWTLLPFQFRDELADEFTLIQQDAATLIRNHVAALPIETGKQPTFLDSRECEPEADCKILIAATPEEICWWAEGIGTRLMLAAPQTSASLQGRPEATFYPEFLTGNLTRTTGNLWQPQPVALISGGSDPDVENRELIQLDVPIQNPQSFRFNFVKRDLAAIAIPTTLLQDAKGLLKVGSTRLQDGRTAEIQEIPIQRAWLCVDSGWLSLDTLQPQSRLKVDPEAPQSTSALTSVLPLSQIVAAFNAEGQNEVLAGMEIELEAMSTSFVAIVLQNWEPESVLSLWIERPKVILQTPRVWYQAPNTVGELPLVEDNTPIDDQPRTQRPVSETLIPSLTTLTDLANGKEVPLEARLHESLLSATFVSKNALEEIPEPPPAANFPQTLQVSVQFDSAANKFVFGWSNGKGMRLWHYSEGYPLVQTVPLSPTAARDRFLDANRGLIPYERKDLSGEVTIEFPSKGLAKLSDTPGDGIDLRSNSWQVSSEFSDQRFFLPTLPGVEMQPSKSGVAVQPWDWFYRHAVPALDEAYTEVVETPTKDGAAPGQTVPVELTRVRESEAFKLFPQTVEERQAKGWLPKTPENPQGVTPIVIESVQLKGRNPALKFKLGNVTEPFIFQRPEFGNPAAITALTHPLQVRLNDSGINAPQFQANWQPNDDGDDLRIVNNGQPLIALWSATRQRVLTLDAEGVVKEESSGTTVQEWQVNQSLHQFRTQTFRLQDQDSTLDTKLQLDIAEIEIRLDDNALEQDRGRGQWMLHDGNGNWAVWRGFRLFPTALLDIRKQDSNLTVQLEAMLLWQTQRYLEKVSSEQLAQLAATSPGRITLTFVGPDSNEGINPSLKLQSVAGTIDWRFRDDPDQQIDALDAKARVVTLLRIKAAFKENAAEPELPMALQEVGLKHSIGLLRLKPNGELAETTCQLANGVLKFAAKRETAEFAYWIAKRETTAADPIELKPEQLTPGIAPPLPGGWEFSWQNRAIDQAPNWKLLHFSPDNWQFRLEQDGVNLTGNLNLRLNQVGPRQFMFQVMEIEQSTTPALAELSWFRIDDAAPEGGFVGVEFTPPEGPFDPQTPELRVTDIAAEIQIFFADREPSTQDAMHLYDPERDELESFDQGTGIVQELQIDLGTNEQPELRAFLGVGAISIGEQIFWCTSEGKVQRWQRNPNEVDSRIKTDATGSSVSVPIRSPGISGSPPSQDFQPQFLILRDPATAQVLVIDHNQQLLFWDLNNPNQPIRDTGGASLSNPIDASTEPILVIASNQRFPDAELFIAWSRKTTDPTQHFLRVWKPVVNRVSPPSEQTNVTAHTGNITAIDFLPPEGGKNWIVSGDVNGNIVVWDPEVAPPNNNIVQILVQQNDRANPTSVPVTALAVMAASQNEPTRLIVSAGSDGIVRLWDEPPIELPTDLPSPLEEISLDRTRKQYFMAARVKKLLPLSDSQLAVLDEDGVVVILTINERQFVTRPSEANGEQELELQLPRILNFFGTVAKSMVWLANQQRLLVVGQPPRTRLGSLLTLKKQDSRLTTDLSVTGWLVLENKLPLREEIRDLGNTPQSRTVQSRTVTHRVRVFLDQAKLPLKAIYQGIGPQQDIFIAGVAEHTLRLSVGNRINKNRPPGQELDPLQQVDRNWQAAQLLRLTTLDRFSQIFLRAAADPAKVQLVIEAGAVFWLRWVNPDLVRRQTASEIFHPTLRIFFRPQEIGRFQTLQDKTDCLHLIRLPFASALQKIQSEPLSIPDNEEDPDKICHDSAGVQTTLTQLPKEVPFQQVAYFRRTNVSLVGSTSAKLQITNFDSLWLQESFLNQILAPSNSPLTGQVSPEIEGRSLSDLEWLRLPPDLDQHPGLNPGNIETRRQRQILAAATLTRFLDQSSPSLFEFPFQMLGSDKPPRLSTAIEAFRNPTKSLDDSYKLTLCNVQLVAFVEGKFVCLAREQLEISEEKLIQQMGGDPEAAKNQLKADLEALKPAYRRGQIRQLLDLLVLPSELLSTARTLEQQVKAFILSWAKTILAARRRSYGAFVLVDFTYVLLVPLSSEIFQEELRYAQTWSAQTLQVDARSRFPRVIPATANPATESQPLVQLMPNPDLNLLLFAATPIAPVPPLPTVAATYFRLAPTGTGTAPEMWFGKLRPAKVATSPQGAQESGDVLGTTMREAIPFEQYDAKTFPRPDTRTRTERPIVYWKDVETVLPPLIDVVSWAARPGELTCTTWNLERTQYENNLVKIGASPETSATLRRPRAIAGQNQSVRLILKPTKTNPQRLDGNRFCYTQLELQQILDRTGANDFPEQEIYAVLATQSEIFRSATSQARAQQSPALIYDTGDQANQTLEDCTLYLLANSQFQPKSDTTRTRLLWTTNPEGLPKIPKDSFNPPSSEVILPDIDINDWINLPGSDSVWQPRDPVSCDLLQDKLPDLDQSLTQTLYLAVIHYRLVTVAPPDGSPADGELPQEYVPNPWAAIAVSFQKEQGRLRTPKLSISVLAAPKDSPEAVILAGYGRLSNSEFSPIRPNAHDSQQIEWLRTAGLEVLHRDRNPDKAANYNYDVVVYGSGGEVFLTESLTGPS